MPKIWFAPEDIQGFRGKVALYIGEEPYHHKLRPADAAKEYYKLVDQGTDPELLWFEEVTQAQYANHLIKNQLVAIDILTTGDDPQRHDMYQLCILPLGSNYDPIKPMKPFYVQMEPRNPENITRHYAKKIIETTKHSLEYYRTADLFEEWFKKLRLHRFRKLYPLAYNWPKIEPFIRDWMGHLGYPKFFLPWHRDLVGTANFLNDYYQFHLHMVPYPKQNFQYLCTRNKIYREWKNDTLYNAKTIAQVYKYMLTDSLITMPSWYTSRCKMNSKLD